MQLIEAGGIEPVHHSDFTASERYYDANEQLELYRVALEPWVHVQGWRVGLKSPLGAFDSRHPHYHDTSTVAPGPG